MCRVHATSVLQIMHMLMQNGLIRLGVLQDVMVLACYLSGEGCMSLFANVHPYLAPESLLHVFGCCV